MSSHREAPEISKDPVADSTDLYAFVSPDQPDNVTIIANYVPLEISTNSAMMSCMRFTSSTALMCNMNSRTSFVSTQRPATPIVSCTIPGRSHRSIARIGTGHSSIP